MSINVKAVLNTKGGVGKSTISFNVLPVVFDNAIVYQVDSSNDMSQEKSKIESKNFGNEVVRAFDDIDFKSLTSEKEVNAIIDVGAGEDTRLFLKQLKEIVQENEIENIDYEFYIPINHNIAQSKNLIDTIKNIKEVISKPKIFVILNRCQSLNPEDIKNQFKGYFGSERYNIKSVLSEIKDDVTKTLFVRDEIYFDILDNEKQYFPDVLPDAERFVKNQKKLKVEVAQKNDEKAFSKFKDTLRKMRDLVEVKDIIMSQFKTENKK